MKKLLLDTGPLGLISHPRKDLEFKAWFARKQREGVKFILSAVADFEVRRELIRANKTISIERLDFLRTQLEYLEVDEQHWLRAAEFWAVARQQGKPTADPKELDCDVVLAAQAEREEATVVTGNVGHLGLFVEAKSWKDIT